MRKKKNRLSKSPYKKKGDELYYGVPNLYAFLTDNLVSENVAEDAQELITAYALKYGKLLDQAMILKTHLPKLMNKIEKRRDELDAAVLEFQRFINDLDTYDC